jgi:hypothetical protein
MSNLMSLKRLLFYLIHLYMFRAFLAHHQEILYCLVSRYGKRKCGRELWCPVVNLVWSVLPCHCLNGRNHEPKIHDLVSLCCELRFISK